MKPPDLKDWSKNELVREIVRLRAVMHEHSARVGDDPRAASTQDAIIGGTPDGRGDALVDARAAVLLDGIDVVLIDTKRDSDPVAMLLSLRGRVNYSDDRVEHAYLLGGDGAAGIVVELIELAKRASRGGSDGERFAQDFAEGVEARRV